MAALEDLGTGLQQSFSDVGAGVVNFVPKLFVALVIFVVGWVIGALIGRFIAQIISALKVDRALQRAQVEEVVNRAGFQLNSGKFIGKLVEWFIIIVFLIAALDVLGLSEINIFLRDTVLGYIPNVFVAAIILVIAALIAEAVGKIVVGSAKAAHLPSAHFLGGISRWAIWVFAIIAALDRLGIASELLLTLFTGMVYMLAIAGGIAFGWGGKDAAARFIERLRGDISGK
jgi:small-conductance mechanosensitive channel